MTDKAFLEALRLKVLEEVRAVERRLASDADAYPHVVLEGLRKASSAADRIKKIAEAAEVVQCAA